MEADLLCVAKSMAGGLPMGATVLHEKLADLKPAFMDQPLVEIRWSVRQPVKP